MTIPTDDLKWLSKNARRKYRRGEMSEEKARKIIANNKNSDVIHITSTAIISKLRENSEFIMSPRIWSFPEDVMRIWINKNRGRQTKY